MRIENLYPKPAREDFAATNQVRDDAATTLSEQSLAITVREQRGIIDALKMEVNTLVSILSAVTPSALGPARMYAEDLRALPVGTVVRDEADRAWTRVSDDGTGVWGTPTLDETVGSLSLSEEAAVYLAWVADR